MSEIFNLADFEVSETAILEVQNKKDDGPLLVNGQPVKIVLYGPGSVQFVRAEARVAKANQARVLASLSGKRNKETVEDDRKQQADRLASCTKELVNFPIDGGPQALYENPKLGYITAQVEKFIGDWGNF